MSNWIFKFPFLLGSFETGIPSFGIETSYPGLIISVTGMARFLPSKVIKLGVFPVRASSNVTFWVTTKSLPSLLKTSCGFSSMTNIRSGGMVPGSWLPFSGKVIFVPLFHPGLISIFKISSTDFGFLHKNVSDVRKKREHIPEFPHTVKIQRVILRQSSVCCLISAQRK